MPKWEALRSNNKHFALYLLQNISFVGVWWNVGKIDANIEAKNVPRSMSRYFGSFWGESKFRRFVGRTKVDRKSKKLESWGPNIVRSVFSGFGACKFVDVYLASFAPPRGRLIQSLTRTPPGQSLESDALLFRGQRNLTKSTQKSMHNSLWKNQTKDVNREQKWRKHRNASVFLREEGLSPLVRQRIH